MGEMEEYRDRIERRYHSRRSKTRYEDGGRRASDYKLPKFWTWEFVAQVFTLILVGLVLLFLTGCAIIKKSLGG